MKSLSLAVSVIWPTEQFQGQFDLDLIYQGHQKWQVIHNDIISFNCQSQVCIFVFTEIWPIDSALPLGTFLTVLVIKQHYWLGRSLGHMCRSLIKCSCIVPRQFPGTVGIKQALFLTKVINAGHSQNDFVLHVGTFLELLVIRLHQWLSRSLGHICRLLVKLFYIFLDTFLTVWELKQLHIQVTHETILYCPWELP